ncbi:MAG: SpoIID/LytB domain-containing protein, partial [Anaerolineae bacterium]|nr:SpoIID/LytB domain-containing protein [Anaerolineae bacterium]
MRRPGLWVANGHPGNTVSDMLSWRPAAITCFYDYLGFNNVFKYKAANPDVKIIVRFQHPQNWQQNPNFYARQLGEQVASKWNDLKPLDPYVYFANEMNLHYENGDPNAGNQHLYTSREFYQKYAQWVRMTAEVIKNITPEMKLVTPPFAFGHHEDGAPDQNGVPTEGWAGYDYLYETVRDYFDNILTFHAYWGHHGGSVRAWLYDPELSSWYAFRWRRLLKLFQNRYNINAKMIIDEAGNFAASDADFTDQIMYHARECLKDARVLAVTYFLWLDPTNSPGNLPNSWVQKVLNLQDHLNRLKNMPAVPISEGEEAQTIRVLFDDGTVQVMPLEEYLRAVVPAEIPALWAAEAVKAQAVASRTYAQYAIEHPRHPNADICTNPAHCQNYELTRIHERSDVAIQATEGVIARYNGNTINALFSANCGGHTFNSEEVFQQALPYLRGVPCPDKGEKRGHGVGMCQYGARALADQGRTYDQIIKHYYTGVTIGQPTPIRTSTVFGTIFDPAGQPVPYARVILTGQGQQAEMSSRTDGTFRFTNVPAGTYRLQLPDFQLQETISPVPGQDLKTDVTLAVLVTFNITASLTRGQGLP